jgi:hypothetical protein
MTANHDRVVKTTSLRSICPKLSYEAPKKMAYRQMNGRPELGRGYGALRGRFWVIRLSVL